uniref:Uncharacterized protein n=1 Tax=Anopheles melas TaxID=34690 RepID=A0A182TZB2_9DIPT
MESSSTAIDDDPFQKIHHQMQIIFTAGFNRMRDRWDEMFDTNLCLAYAKQLPDHMTAFYEEVYQESNQRREHFVAEIAELRQEALELQRLLSEQQQGLPAGIESHPLFEQRSALDASLEQMQQKLSQRHEIIDEYMLEMETLLYSGEPYLRLRRFSTVRRCFGSQHAIAEQVAQRDRCCPSCGWLW